MSEPSQAVGPATSDALFRSSASPRWLACPGSVALCRQILDASTSEAAREGTAVHLISEMALRGEREPIEMLGRFLVVDGHRVEITEPMVDGADFYVGYVRRRVEAGCGLEIECRVSLEPLDPTDAVLRECRGTADSILTDYIPDILEIPDLKYGRGYMVPANSRPTRLYGLMAMLRRRATPPRIIRTTIVQPRDPNEAERIRSHDYEPADLWEFVAEVYGAIDAAMQPDAPLRPGAEQCQWCPARGICPALATEALGVARSAFQASPILTASSPVPSVATAPQLPSVDQASDDELGCWLDRRDLVDAWFKGVEETAARRLTIGRLVPGWKMVPRTGNRRFRDPETAPAHLMALGLTAEQIYGKPKLLGPAPIEKLLPEEQRGALAELVERPDNGLALVRTENKKAAALGVFGPAPTIDA